MYLHLILLIIEFLSLTNILIESKHQILKQGESIIHLKFFDRCLTSLNKSTDFESELRFKILFLDSKSNKLSDDNIEIFVLNEKQNVLVKQDQFGHLYDPNEFVLISIKLTNIETHSLIIEFLKPNQLDSITKTYNTFAFSPILPFANTSTNGVLTNPILEYRNQNLIGKINVAFLVIRPIVAFDADVEQMIDVSSGVYIGHRGTGVGRRNDLPEKLLENTIEAFNYACHHKANWIELDIQLSKDKIPIIHHDFTGKVLLKEKFSENFDITDIQVKDLPFALMTNISTLENQDFDRKDNQPFETLKRVLEKVEPKCGINFEIKYPQEQNDGTWDGEPGLELNEYIDIILKTLYENIGNRPGIITSFHPDLCAMVRLKQNKFAIALLTSGDVLHWNPKARHIRDPRAASIPVTTYFANGLQLDGLSVHARDLLANSSLVSFVKSYNQLLYVWGNPLNTLSIIDGLKEMGANGLIFDKIDKILEQKSD